MILLQALLVAQVMECPLEPELRLAPMGDYRPLTLSKKAAAKGFEAWGGVVRGAPVELTRRAADGAVGLVVGSALASLRPMGLMGVEGVVQIPLGRHGFARAPLGVRVLRAALGYGAQSVTIQATASVYAAARCGSRVALFDLDWKGPQGLDVNGDGRVDVNSPAEFSRVSGGSFEVDGKAFAMEKVDWNRRVLVLRQVPLGPGFALGEVLPDYFYVDRLGERRQLSGHGESYTLVDFWASWCGPCIGAFPQLKAIASSHDIRLLGINGDEDAAAALRVLAQFEVLWPHVQATVPPELFDYRLRVALYPTYLLLDSSRKVVLRTESTMELIEEIRRIVPARKLP